MVPMFKNADEDFLNAVVSKFSYEVFLEGDLIINSYVHGTTMYFIQHGEAQLLNCNGEVVRVLVDGDYFGGLVVFVSCNFWGGNCGSLNLDIGLEIIPNCLPV